MRQLSEQEIRAAFVNCTKGEAKRLAIPHDLDEQPWADLDYFGWRDPQAPDRAYLVTELDGHARAVALRCPSPSSWQTRRSMCSICLTTHTGGVSLMVAAKAGKAGQQGNSVGAYSPVRCMCGASGTRAWAGACRSRSRWRRRFGGP
jgi:hypothetical protein